MPCSCLLVAYAGLFFPDGQPRTIRFQSDQWQNNSWGFLSVDRRRSWGSVAISSDGSRSNVLEFEQRKYYFIPQEHTKTRSLYRNSEHTAYWIDDQQHVANRVRCACTWTRAELRKDDSECSRTASDYMQEKGVAYGMVAGIPVVRYRFSDESTSEEIALAPLFGCELMDYERSVFNDLGLPTSYYHFTVTSYVPGEPDPVLLMLPQGYRIVETRR